MMEFDKEVDARGLNCPLPILRAKKALADMQSGQILKVLATDPGSQRDFAAFAKQTGNQLVDTHTEEKTFVADPGSETRTCGRHHGKSRRTRVRRLFFVPGISGPRRSARYGPVYLRTCFSAFHHGRARAQVFLELVLDFRMAQRELDHRLQVADLAAAVETRTVVLVRDDLFVAHQ
jgi:tRNA 2-thiouridine synthesizing protein A